MEIWRERSRPRGRAERTLFGTGNGVRVSFGSTGKISVLLYGGKSVVPTGLAWLPSVPRSEEHTSELQSRFDLVCRPLLDLHSFPTRRSSDLDLETCLRYGNLAGAFSTTRAGGTDAFRDRQWRESFFREHR